jgi:hypothetical protein
MLVARVAHGSAAVVIVRAGMSAAISLGQRVLWRGRIYVIDGVDPMSVVQPRVHLRDAKTGEALRVPVTDLDPQRLPGT